MISYIKGYKYQLAKDYEVKTPITVKILVYIGDFIQLAPDGLLRINAGYTWDGPSGPTFDTKTFMRASLVHDALYQLMRYDLLHRSWRKTADKLMYRMNREDGMCRLRAWWVYKSLRIAAGSAASKDNKKKVITAP